MKREFVERFGKEHQAGVRKGPSDHGERLARLALATLPKGTWTAHDFVDNDGVDLDRMIGPSRSP